MPEYISNASEILDRLDGDDPELHQLIREATANFHIAQLVYDARAAADLTQKQLAERVGVSPSVIARLEDADYDGDSLSMLQRIAAALGRRVEVRLVPAVEPERQSA